LRRTFTALLSPPYPEKHQCSKRGDNGQNSESVGHRLEKPLVMGFGSDSSNIAFQSSIILFL
jgi:hypothetical protein